MFRKIRQEGNELVGQFISKLRQQIAKCGFADADTEMCDQIIEHYTSDELRQKLLEENNLTSLTRKNLPYAKFSILRYWYPWIQKK